MLEIPNIQKRESGHFCGITVSTVKITEMTSILNSVLRKLQVETFILKVCDMIGTFTLVI
jgi:hypothetical protein